MRSGTTCLNWTVTTRTRFIHLRVISCFICMPQCDIFLLMSKVNSVECGSDKSVNMIVYIQKSSLDMKEEPDVRVQSKSIGSEVGGASTLRI